MTITNRRTRAITPPPPPIDPEPEKFTVLRSARRTVVKAVSEMGAGEVLLSLACEAPDRAARLREIVESMRPDQYGGPLHQHIASWWPAPQR
jgi:hypothetical protein